MKVNKSKVLALTSRAACEEELSMFQSCRLLLSTS